METRELASPVAKAESEEANGCQWSQNGEEAELHYATEDYTAETDVQVRTYGLVYLWTGVDS